MLSDSQVELFHQQGFLVLPSALSHGEQLVLANTCDQLLAEPPDDDLGGKAHDIGRGQDRRFLRHRHADFPALEAFVLGPRMKALVGPLLGGNAHLFNEQFVVKGPKKGAAFGWHQDSGYVGFDHPPYVSAWMAIDDITPENGPLSVLPRNLRTQCGIEPHVWDEQAKEYVGYSGDEPGVGAVVPRGSVVLFSSLTLHRSSPNTSAAPRRAYLAQYSNGPVIDPATGQPKRFATRL